MNPLITVVIHTYLREDMLRACLLALSQQKLSLSQFEVVVVDLANDRDTAAVVRDVADETGLSIRYVCQRRNRSEVAAYNRGWKIANSPFVAFTRDTCLPQPPWLATALPLFYQGAQVVVGRVQYQVPNHPAPVSAMANLLCSRALLEKIGGFDEWEGPKKSYYVDWLDKLASEGISLTPCPEAVVVCPSRRPSWLSTLRLRFLKLV